MSCWYIQGRREPNLGLGPAQILRISVFVNSKTDGKNAAVLSEFRCDLKKKKKKIFGVPRTDFFVSFRWALCWAP